MESRLDIAGGWTRKRAAVRRHPTARRVILAWRRLTEGGKTPLPTLVACSGGSDSTALAVMLAAVSGEVVLGHVVHDLRDRGEALADRDAVRELAGRLGVAFAEAAVAVRREGGNAEGAARRLRYRALAEMARAHGCGFVATAHHADDQLESMLMALVRGAGARGLSGITPSRRLAGGVTLVRPMLSVTRAEAEALCDGFGFSWQTDATNFETGRLRAALRARVLPVLEELRPGAAARAARGAGLVRGAAGLLAREGARVAACGAWSAESVVWERSTLRRVEPVVLGEALRASFARLTGGAGLDRLSGARLEAMVRAVRSGSGEPKRFVIGSVEMEVGRVFVRLGLTHEAEGSGVEASRDGANEPRA